MEMKYVMVNGIIPILFPAQIDHSKFSGICGEITSAGFYRIKENGVVETYGYSMSLAQKPDVYEDAWIISKLVKGK